MLTAWILLIIAGLLEPCWAVSMKKSNGFRNVRWTLATIAFLAASLYLLFVVMSSLPAGTAYAVWTGIGAVCTLLAGMLLFKERTTVLRVFFAVLTVAGIIGLYITAGV
ncbi:MAG: multidrug efflux SMR transporter [Methanomassiliicoccaceae archaeon]|nr:multidrug efflux SMR transporter [Methanomassiliicoccaceae archaeon]